MTPKSVVDPELMSAPKPRFRYRPLRSISQLMAVVVLAGLGMAAFTSHSRRLNMNSAMTPGLKRAPFVPAPLRLPQQGRSFPLAPSAGIDDGMIKLMPQGIDDAMIKLAPQGIDDAMLFNPYERRGTASELSPQREIAPGVLPPGPR
jgi:hypothetical protein